MSAPSGSLSPSGEKPSTVVTDWLAHELIEVVSFEPVSNVDLELAHCPDYVRDIFAGNIANGHYNYDLAVAESTRWTVGSMVADGSIEKVLSIHRNTMKEALQHCSFDPKN